MYGRVTASSNNKVLQPQRKKSDVTNVSSGDKKSTVQPIVKSGPITDTSKQDKKNISGHTKKKKPKKNGADKPDVTNSIKILRDCANELVQQLKANLDAQLVGVVDKANKDFQQSLSDYDATRSDYAHSVTLEDMRDRINQQISTLEETDEAEREKYYETIRKLNHELDELHRTILEEQRQERNAISYQFVKETTSEIEKNAAIEEGKIAQASRSACARFFCWCCPSPEIKATKLEIASLNRQIAKIDKENPTAAPEKIITDNEKKRQEVEGELEQVTENLPTSIDDALDKLEHKLALVERIIELRAANYYHELNQLTMYACVRLYGALTNLSKQLPAQNDDHDDDAKISLIDESKRQGNELLTQYLDPKQGKLRLLLNAFYCTDIKLSKFADFYVRYCALTTKDQTQVREKAMNNLDAGTIAKLFPFPWQKTQVQGKATVDSIKPSSKI